MPGAPGRRRQVGDLRVCLTCGEVGCCDSSPNRHASRHARETGHALATSFEPGEDWVWCDADGQAVRVDGLSVLERNPYPGQQPPYRGEGSGCLSSSTVWIRSCR